MTAANAAAPIDSATLPAAESGLSVSLAAPSPLVPLCEPAAVLVASPFVAVAAASAAAEPPPDPVTTGLSSSWMKMAV